HENRPEIRQLSLSQEINKIDIDYFRNQAKPQIDLIAGYSTNGLGGTGPLITRPDCAPVPVKGPDGQDLQPICATLGLRQDAPGVFTPVAFDIKAPTITSQPPVSDQFIGGYGTALGNLFKNEFRTWTVGVQFSLPLRNRTAKANLGKALETERQIGLQTRQLMQNIEVDVRNAVQAVETAKMRIDAAQPAERCARQQLEGEDKKYEAGLQSTYFVMDRQNPLSAAQLSTRQAQADYNTAIANLQRVMSTTLSTNSIEIPKDAPVTI